MKRIIYSFLLFSLCIVPINTIGQELFSEQMAFISFLTLDSIDAEVHANEYFYRFDSKAYQSLREDEFERMHRIKELTGKIESVLGDKQFYVHHQSEFGMYDFDNHQFGFQPFPEGMSLSMCDYIFISRLTTNTKIDIIFDNAAEIQALPLDYDKARFLVKMRKDDRSGNVDRRIYLKVNFKIAATADIAATSENRKSVMLHGNIMSIEVFQSDNYLSEPLAVIETNYKKQLDMENSQQEAAAENREEEELAKAVAEMNKILSSSEHIDESTKEKIIQAMLKED